eukprot:Phypoly_transcript_17125.p1 GENE.Phypoly_transcript_17125~~Phypoly_transcript_17125.p1  ORF type:complete len:125 (-),score=3.04 Phypoly_transcript_17125:296-670(-)
MVLLKLEGVRALAPMGVQVADDRLDEVSCGAVASHVSSPYLASFDHFLHCICNHAGVILKIEMPQHVGGRQQHGCGVGYIPAHCLGKWVPSTRLKNCILCTELSPGTTPAPPTRPAARLSIMLP